MASNCPRLSNKQKRWPVGMCAEAPEVLCSQHLLQHCFPGSHTADSSSARRCLRWMNMCAAWLLQLVASTKQSESSAMQRQQACTYCSYLAPAKMPMGKMIMIAMGMTVSRLRMLRERKPSHSVGQLTSSGPGAYGDTVNTFAEYWMADGRTFPNCRAHERDTHMPEWVLDRLHCNS